MMQDLELGITTQQTELDLPQAYMVRINDMALLIQAAGNSVEFAQMNFSFAPCRPKGGPVFNFRSDGWIAQRVDDVSSQGSASSNMSARNRLRRSISSR